MFSRTRAIATILVATAVLAVGCGDDDEGAGGDIGEATTATPTPEETASPEPEEESVTVTQGNFQFSPSAFSVPSGSVITVSNGDPRTPHTFTVENIDVVNDAQQVQEVTIDLDPGTYEFVCRFHEGQGMTGSITVT